MPNNPPRRHHTVPRLYLQRFSAPSSGRRRLWVIDAESGHERPGSVSNETVWNDFYGPFESALAQRIDTGRIGGLFDRIEAGEAFAFTEEEAATLHLYLGIQATRTSSFREHADDMLHENLKERLRSDGLGFDAEVLHALAARNVGEQVKLMLEIAGAMAGVICQMKMLVVRAPSSNFFVTSDSPVAIGPFFDGHERALGLWDDALAFALSPRTALLMCRHLPESRYVQAASRSHEASVSDVVSKVNRLIVRRCRRWLYADRQDAAKRLGLTFPLERLHAVTRRIAPGFVETRTVLTRKVDADEQPVNL